MNTLRLWLTAATICVGVPASAQTVTAVTGGTVIGGGGAPIADAVVVIEGTRIARVGPAASTPVPPDATIVDARGRFLIPGLADMHNHARSGSSRVQQNLRTNLSVLLGFGVTTIFNPSSSTADFRDLKTAAGPDAAPFPRFFGSGPMMTVKGDGLGAAVGAPAPETVDDARAAVAALKRAGVDAIKVNRDDFRWASTFRPPLMPSDVLRAIVAEAHREGLKVFAHAPLLDHAKDVLRAGADGLLHGIVDRPVDQELIDLLVRNRATYVPTLSLYEDVADLRGWVGRQSTHDERGFIAPLAAIVTSPAGIRQFETFFNDTAFTRQRLATQRANLKRVSDAGVPVVMGTDSGFYGVLMGVSSHMELALMVEAGLTPEAALRAATINAARMIGREQDLGTIEPGKAADLLVLDANPLEDIRHVRRLHRVIKGGTVYDPARLLGAVTFVPAGR